MAASPELIDYIDTRRKELQSGISGWEQILLTVAKSGRLISAFPAELGELAVRLDELRRFAEQFHIPFDQEIAYTNLPPAAPDPLNVE